jgi:outer membrane protein OmpA-like peptidoglycan-associated protein
MKNLLVISFLILITWQNGLAQKAQVKKADQYFSQFQYASAAKLYENFLSANPKDYRTMEKLVQCYDKLNDPQRAESWLSVICHAPDVDVKYYKMYGRALAASSKYEESAKWYAKYSDKVSDSHIKNTALDYHVMASFYKDSTLYTVNPLVLNSGYSDFSPAFFNEGILFCSARGTGKNDSKYAWNNTSFIDLFYSTDVIAYPKNFGSPVNSPLHEGPATFTSNYDTIFFTRNNITGKSNDGTVKLKIYFSALKNGIWQKEQSLELNSNEYSIGHPAFSPDHKLYFVSDMPGGVGGTDIYYSKFINGHWTKPANAGMIINTTGNEMFPSFDAEGNLYFASNTHPGLGGLDIFLAKADQEKFMRPTNMGYPINTPSDDFGLIIKGNNGYFSSNRGNDSKNDNIYKFSFNKTKAITIMVNDKNGESITHFNVKSESSNHNISFKEIDSVYTYALNADESYSLTIDKKGYLKQTLTITSENLREIRASKVITVTLEQALKKTTIELQSMEGKLIDGELQITNLKTRETAKYKTDKNGTLELELDQQADYEITGSKPNFKTKSINLSSASVRDLAENGSVVINLPLATTLFDKNEVGQIIELDIKYDKAKSDIRKDASKELDKLVSFLQKNPTVKVELGSHTDVRGSDESNLVLSQKRAESCVRYIVSKGISSKRLIPIGYGEDDLKVKDAQTEDDHQQNRRTTVKIVGI